jgi:hypothetical protein
MSGYNSTVKGATDSYVNNMLPYADAGKGLVNDDGSLKYGAQNTSASPVSGFDTLGQVNDYLDPSLGFQIQNATDQVASRYGNRGSLFSGAAGNAVADTARSMAEQGWADAFNRATNANQLQFQNQLSVDGFNNGAANQNFTQQSGINNQNFSNHNDIYGTKLGQEVNAASVQAQLDAAKKSPWDYAMDAAKLTTGGYFAGKMGGLF